MIYAKKNMTRAIFVKNEQNRFAWILADANGRKGVDLSGRRSFSDALLVGPTSDNPGR